MPSSDYDAVGQSESIDIRRSGIDCVRQCLRKTKKVLPLFKPAALAAPAPATPSTPPGTPVPALGTAPELAAARRPCCPQVLPLLKEIASRDFFSFYAVSRLKGSAALLGSAPARPLCLFSARLAALGSSALPV